MPEERFVDRGGVRLHYLQDGDDLALTPVVYLPGGLGGAAHFTEEMERLLADHPDRLGGVVILDYPARYPAPAPRWVEETRAALPDHPAHVIQRLHEEGEEVLLWDRLGEITCPGLVIYGGKPDAALRSEDADRYRELLPQARVVEFEDANHHIWRPDYERFMGEIEAFLSELDAG